MERLLQPYETVVLHARDEAFLRISDAAAVSLLINNQPAKSLGADGEIVTRLITRTNYSSYLSNEF